MAPYLAPFVGYYDFLHSISWEALVVDEGHRLKNHQSLLHQELIQVTRLCYCM